MKHLWEVDHPYYMNEGNYYKAGAHITYSSFDDFISEWGGFDRDLNRVHRWDWVVSEGEGKDTLCVFFVLQRKARLMSCEMLVDRSEEGKVIEYLKPFADLERSIWEPLL